MCMSLNASNISELIVNNQIRRINLNYAEKILEFNFFAISDNLASFVIQFQYVC